MNIGTEKLNINNTAEDLKHAERVMANIDVYSLATSFIMMLAQKAWVNLGKIATNPDTGETKIDLPQAQFAIDCFAAVFEKLKDRIDEKEANELQTMLTNLRLNYVGTVNQYAKK